jgi:cytochrome c biogenesis protein
MSRPSDHYDEGAPARNAKLGFGETLRWVWTQLTSMRTALLLLLLLAVAAVPGSLLPQRAADPNGVTQYFDSNKDLAPVLDKFQLFDVYTSVWFSAIYILLFVSLIGCVIPRTKHHWDALRARPPRTPSRLDRLPGFAEREFTGVDVERAYASAARVLKSERYRIERYERDGVVSVSAERGYLRETGNLVFHFALVGVLIAVGFGGSLGYSGQRVVIEGQAFSNTLLAYDSFNPGRFFTSSALVPYNITLNKFTTKYEVQNTNALGQATDYTANITAQLREGEPFDTTIKVNEPLEIGNTNVYLLGNGYAPVITVTNAEGKVIFNDAVPFLAQDKNFTSVGVVKLPDGLSQQFGMIGFFYPTVVEMHGGAKASSYPDLIDPELTFNVYQGDLGINEGIPKSVYTLDITKMTKLTGTKTDLPSLEMKPGESAQLPNGMGTVTFEKVVRYVSLDVHHDPAQGWVLAFAMLAMLGLFTSLFIPRRRMWVSIRRSGENTITLEYAALARGDDPTLEAAVLKTIEAHIRDLGLTRD